MFIPQKLFCMEFPYLFQDLYFSIQPLAENG